MTEEQKRKIARGQAARWARQREQAPFPVSAKKKCTGPCGEWKVYNLEFPEISDFSRSTKVVGGEKVWRPQGECKQCAAERARKRRQDTDPQVRADQARKWNANRDPEHKRVYVRHHERRRRRKQGAKMVGPHKRFVGERGDGVIPDSTADVWVDAEPVLRLWEELKAGKGNESDYLQGLGLGGQALNAARARSKIKLYMVDRILTACGVPDQVQALYGDSTTGA